VSNDRIGALFADAITKVMELIPKEGLEGTFPCPACNKGEVRWLRVGRKLHLRVGCTTPGCVMLIQ
jgi:hypothetical protein